MKLLLDTQILVWLASDRSQLSEAEKTVLGDPHELIVSVLSIFELRTKARAESRKGRLPTVLPPAHAIAFCAAKNLPIHSLVPAVCAVELAADPPQGDPFDEMLLAHAQALNARLLTRDRQLIGHPLAYPL